MSRRPGDEGREADLDTLRPSTRSRRGPAEPAPALTLLAHPDLGRVGEVARPMRLRLGAPLPLCRLEPAFLDGRGEGRPLETPFVSRRPVRLVPHGDRIAVEPSEGIPPVRVDGHPLEATLEIPRAALESGVVIELGTEVALLLHHLPPEASQEPAPDPRLLGRSPVMDRLRRRVRGAAGATGPVLILGETGTGKELVAHAIHELGPRRGHPFVSVNMAAVTASIAQSALFGHVRGAFTGADGRHPGYFQQAHEGTLFLDEIGAATDDLQSHLLRVLETGEVQRLGGTHREKVDVRMLAATDTPLGEAVAHGRFSRALFHRLAAYVVQVPPLRARRDDVARLFLAFLRRELEACGVDWDRPPGTPAGQSPVSAAFMRRLTLHDWPGNVRELQNVARQAAAALRTGDDLEAVLDGLEALDGAPAASTQSASLRHGPAVPPPTPEAVRSALAEHDWQPGAAARALGLSRATLYRLMAQDPGIRAAKDVPERELRRCWEEVDGDVRALAARLRVSERGLVLRLSHLKWRAPNGHESRDR